jgi:predicted peptidase
MTTHGPLRARHAPPQPVGSGSGATQRFVIIAPQLPANLRENKWHVMADRVAAIALDAVARYKGNRLKIYLTGFSYGGNGVLNIGSFRPDVWAALWPVDPGTWTPVAPNGTSVNIPDQPLWVSAGPHAEGNHGSFTKYWTTVDHDWKAPDKNPDPRRVYENKRLDHPATATAAYGNRDIYTWLLMHKLPQLTQQAGLSKT